MVIVALIVLFGAALIGKMLMDMYPGSGFALPGEDRGEGHHPAE